MLYGRREVGFGHCVTVMIKLTVKPV